MEWKHVRHVPVTDARGALVGLIGYRTVLHLVAVASDRPVAVSEVMRRGPVSVAPGATCLDAVGLMRAHAVGCLPVVEEGALVGIVTASDFIRLSAGLLDEWLAG
jgi:CBS domain-containing protein